MGSRAYLSRHAFDRTARASIVALTAFGVQWYRFATFRSAVYDLSVFEQVVWKMAHGHGATSSLTAWNTFGDHLSPVLLVFVPLYRLAATPAVVLRRAGDRARSSPCCAFARSPTPSVCGSGPTSPMPSGRRCPQPRHLERRAVRLSSDHARGAGPPGRLHRRATAAARSHVAGARGARVPARRPRPRRRRAGASSGGRLTPARGRRIRTALVAAALAWTVIGAQVGTALGASRHFVARYGYLGDVDDRRRAAPLPLGDRRCPTHAATGENSSSLSRRSWRWRCLPLLRPAWALLAGFVPLPNLLANDTNLHPTRCTTARRLRRS